MEKVYGTEPLYVWLRRDRVATAESWSRRTEIPTSQINAWPKAAFFGAKGYSPLEIAQLMVDSTEDNIQLFLKDKNYIEAWIENPIPPFAQMWEQIGAEGDYESAIAEFEIRHNAT